MKTGIGTVKKTKGNGSARPGNGSGESPSAGDKLDCAREQLVAEAAYFRAQQRGFAPGNELSDWLQAEADIESVGDTSGRSSV